MKFLAPHKIDGAPHIVVDGAADASAGTRMTLSHWPGAQTDSALKADLSAQIAFKSLDLFEQGVLDYPANLVTNNHFDEDGLVSAFVLTNPELAKAHRETLIDVASAGDFGVFKERSSARVAFVLSAWADAELSPLNAGVFALPHFDLMAVLYEELLLRLPKIIDKVDNLRRYWLEEDNHLEESIVALARGDISLEEDPDLDLAVVRLSDNYPASPRAKSQSWISSLLHPMALHNSTDCTRIAVLARGRYEFYYRYETWVDFVSRKLLPRLDLTELASRLAKFEERGTWQYNGNGEIIARLKLAGSQKSNLSESDFLSLLKERLSINEAL